MKYQTFIKIYYSHRIIKANFIRKIFFKIFLPIFYLINKLLYPKIVDLDEYQKKNFMLFSRDLNYLFQYFNSDKGSYFKNQYIKPIKFSHTLIEGHNYQLYYEKYLKDIKFENNNVLEIGSFKGNAAAALFFYLKNSKIYSADIFPDLYLYKSERIKNFYIDSSNEEHLRSLVSKENQKFELIIEDAGHYLKDQIISLFILFKILKKKGTYVVEDLDFPDTRKDMNTKDEKPTLKEILQHIKNGTDFNSKYVSNEEKIYFLSNLESIEIFKGKFNEIAFIKKK
tara:strand:+ start:1765 stop:2613 length:849 start_codon:yes stop_codon:yes gene_type:complete